ncbi:MULTISPECIES: isocitrate lyase/PEP mutase family protein [Streptomycetaceae]|uniref:2-Methylisocitrate lyase, PEP mutase family n=1 Tax=Streptantibioticus cattleyicolor (strain ATCC 35852 / DSM 46488 / JCM 4925 / NBRC 14057 / NRRL 8057) TaxID=1003195 RepID=F8JX65_STREN|nr:MULTISPECIES: isocitrate lyase/phosphoenolpyruvate mutase family protein [Streptomycetaceae]AEW94532.1 hypothetical protein SCATT_21610 [Streptantibioticus cattleyicolor NRRL 8057 = DSM 46488]MYS59172.1 isocitrate lyase/phosphoenolpyruvate mutase family protein [Streptomyces sp. SID5468]CCB74889.1 PEP phosphonomutase-like enzyme [Streptantibioticus cattleyicolor NRRL 8057 = DSM 46488]
MTDASTLTVPPGLADRARLFHSLHTGGSVLALPNAWDAGSARIIEDAGATAIATTSSGVAWALGAADGGHVDPALVADVVARITAVVSVPVTVDIEDGYGADPAGVAATVRAVLAAGGVGVNIEDSRRDPADPLRPVAEQAERITAARQAADAAGVPLYVNARCDVMLRRVGDPAGRLDATVERARAYLAAGADGIFVPGTTDPATVRRLADAIDAPLNVLSGPGDPSVPELAAAGAARVSIGGAIPEAVYALTRRAVRELLTDGTCGTVADALAYPELNALFRN